MAAIHQFVAGFSNGDAISNEAIVMRGAFRSWGFESQIFCTRKSILPELRNQASDVNEYPAVCKPDDVVLLHLSIGSQVNDVFASIKCRKAILYHNVTPSHYFDLVNKTTAFDLEKGRKQVAVLANAAQVNMADSLFNAGEITRLGYRNVSVLPLILDLDRLKSNPDRGILKRYDDDITNVIFVGRCAPNKKIEDVIRAFYFFHKSVEPNSRFIHVGSFGGTERYYYLLLALARDLDLSTCVHFAGSVIQSHLNAYYECADMFLSMSEHEGFCIPVIESMVHDVPVMAYAAAAVPETMDGAGILFDKKQYEAVSEMMGRVVRDQEFRAAVIANQRKRLERYRQRNLLSELRQMLDPLLHS
jgi:glycosyltransferase involved in cell wall biosynthesis